MPLCTPEGPDEVDVGAGQVKASDLGQGGSRVVSLGLCWDCPAQVRGGACRRALLLRFFWLFCFLLDVCVCGSQSRPESED